MAAASYLYSRPDLLIVFCDAHIFISFDFALVVIYAYSFMSGILFQGTVLVVSSGAFDFLNVSR